MVVVADDREHKEEGLEPTGSAEAAVVVVGDAEEEESGCE